MFLKAKSAIKVMKEERIIEETPKFFEVEKEIESRDMVEGVYVPYYWKSGIFAEEKDYLSGYIPSIKEFSEYVETKNSLIYGNTSKKSVIPDYKTALSLLNESNIFLANGIKNQHSYFNWKEGECSVVENSKIGGKIFICDNWVNWLKGVSDDPLFVLTDCRIDNQQGRCLFIDYTREYFGEKKITENRCLTSNAPEFCDWEKYIKLIKYKEK